MKKALLVMVIAVFGYTMAAATPLERVPGVVSYSVNYSVYFDNEDDAVRWLKTQTDFVERRESSAGQRRMMASMMETMFPGWTYMVRLHSDFLVMVVRSPNTGESSLSLYVRGELTRLWQY